MTSHLQYIDTYQAQVERASFLKYNPIDWSTPESQKVASWGIQSQDTALLDHIVETAPDYMVDFILSELFEHREHLKNARHWAGKLLHRHSVNTDRILLACSRHLEAEWMVLLAPFASDTIASKAYGTILHYTTPRTIGRDMWGKELVNRFFDEQVERLLEKALLNDPNGSVRWNMVLDDIDLMSDLSQRISALLQNQRLHQEIKDTTVNKSVRKI